MAARNVEYNPKRISACIMRIREPPATAKIFGTGKVVVTGCKSEVTARLAARIFARIVQKIVKTTSFFDFRICNMVGHYDMKFSISLEGMANALRKETSYEHERFPGLFFTMLKPKVVVVVFVTGKIFITGAKTRQDIQQAFHNICPILNKFQVGK